MFLGVSIIEGDTKGITMELEMQWDGNPNIELDVKTKVGVGLPIQVLFHLFLVSRVILVLQLLPIQTIVELVELLISFTVCSSLSLSALFY